MKAIWGIDYDYHTDQNYERPCCPECCEPIGLKEDEQYHCFNCGKVVEVDDPMIIKWFEERAKTKVEYEDCEILKTKDGDKISGCGRKNCVRVLYRRNPVDLKWEAAYGVCEKCGTRWIV